VRPEQIDHRVRAFRKHRVQDRLALSFGEPHESQSAVMRHVSQSGNPPWH
jgi:hypothetical protein